MVVIIIYIGDGGVYGCVVGVCMVILYISVGWGVLKASLYGGVILWFNYFMCIVNKLIFITND
jgi:hypothetical protein